MYGDYQGKAPVSSIIMTIHDLSCIFTNCLDTRVQFWHHLSMEQTPKDGTQRGLAAAAASTVQQHGEDIR